MAILSRSSLSKQQRIDYTAAVRCLQKKPHILPNTQVPGARSRFDDVIATHILQAPYIHFSVSPSHVILNGFFSGPLPNSDRVSFSLGTATTPISTTKSCARNVDTAVLSPTGTGHCPTKIHGNPRSLTARWTRWAAMARPSPTIQPKSPPSAW